MEGLKSTDSSYPAQGVPSINCPSGLTGPWGQEHCKSLVHQL